MSTRRVSIVLSLALMVAGCASRPDTVVFVTKSSLGVDVEQTPPSASIAYDRVEGYFGPRYESGAVPPVLAVFMTNGQLLDRQVKQLYATGDAARALLAPAAPLPSDPEQGGDFKPMFFGSSTTVGLKIGYEAGGSTSTFTLGYKRKELSVIPVISALIGGNTAVLKPSEVTPISGEVVADFFNRLGLPPGVAFHYAGCCRPVPGDPIVGLMTEWERDGALQRRGLGGNLGGTMRLGAYPATLVPGSRVAEVYGSTEISERHRHRYEVNTNYAKDLAKHGMTVSGWSPDGRLPEIMEIPAHPWFIGVQFHPELKSKPFDPHPLFKGFIEAAVKQSRLV